MRRVKHAQLACQRPIETAIGSIRIGRWVQVSGSGIPPPTWVVNGKLVLNVRVWWWNVLTSRRECVKLMADCLGGKESMHAPRCMMMRTCLNSVPPLAAVFVLLLGYAAPVEADVDLVYFRVTVGGSEVLIEWETGSEETTFGFNLYRTEQDIFVQPTHLNNGEMIEAQNFPGMIGAKYSHIDGPLEIGLYFYWLEVLDTEAPKVYGPEPATVGPTPTPTPRSTATKTPTSTPGEIPTSTPTRMPTATWTPTPIETPTFAPTGVPSATPTSALSATPTTAPTFTPSPTMTSAGTGEVTPTSTPTTHIVGALTEQTESQERSTQPRATDWRPPGLSWPTVSTSTFLLFLSVISFLGVLLLATALVLVRKFGL